MGEFGGMRRKELRMNQTLVHIEDNYQIRLGFIVLLDIDAIDTRCSNVAVDTRGGGVSTQN